MNAEYIRNRLNTIENMLADLAIAIEKSGGDVQLAKDLYSLSGDVQMAAISFAMDHDDELENGRVIE